MLGKLVSTIAFLPKKTVRIYDVDSALIASESNGNSTYLNPGDSFPLDFTKIQAISGDGRNIIVAATQSGDMHIFMSDGKTQKIPNVKSQAAACLAFLGSEKLSGS